MSAREQLLAFFYARTSVRGDAECWPWVGTVNKATGYGEASIGPRGATERWRAHRLSFFLLKGPLADDLVVMHSCDNRRCVNPSHLSLGTSADNVDDMMSKGRHVAHNALKTHCAYGHPLSGNNVVLRKRGGRDCRACIIVRHRAARKAKREAIIQTGGAVRPVRLLTEELVRQIRQRYAAGESMGQIATSLGVNRATASDAAFGRLWKHVTEPPPVTSRPRGWFTATDWATSSKRHRSQKPRRRSMPKPQPGP